MTPVHPTSATTAAAPTDNRAMFKWLSNVSSIAFRDPRGALENFPRNEGNMAAAYSNGCAVRDHRVHNSNPLRSFHSVADMHTSRMREQPPAGVNCFPRVTG